MKPDGRRYLLANNHMSGVIVSVTLEEMAPGRSGMSCKEIMSSRVANTPENMALYAVTGEEMKNIRIWQTGDKTFLEYFVPKITAPGQKPIEVDQQNRFLCMKRDNVFVDLHVSKPHFQPGDQKLFDPIFDSVQFHEGLTRTAMDYFLAGTSYYTQNEFKRAIPFYAQALALEQQDRKLDKKFWYVLVDNLGMAYGLTGDLDMARKTFEYGIQTDPDYPMFYYEMADYFGEKGDSPNAIAYLQKAYDRRANFIAGEKFPDPRDDDSFKKLLKNPEFKRFVYSLVEAPAQTRHP